MLLDKCFVNKPFTSARQYTFRHNKRKCYEAPLTNASCHEVNRHQPSRFKPDSSAVRSSQQQSSNNTQRQVPAAVADCLKPYVTAQSRWWQWKYNSKVHYRQQGSCGPCVLLVHGFGVGAFHFEKLIDKLSATCQVWAVDLLGQGMSWPDTEPAEGESCSCCALFTLHILPQNSQPDSIPLVVSSAWFCITHG